MRVAHISDCYLPRTGGIELQVRGLSQAQHAVGQDPIVITATPAAKGKPVIPGETDEGVPIHRLALNLPAGLPVTTHVGKRVRDLVTTADAVHVHGGLVSVFAWPALRTAVKAGVPAVVSVHSVWAGWSRAFSAADTFWGWRTWPVIWTGVSDLAAEGILAALGGKGDVRVLNNGIDLSRWRPDPGSEVVPTAHDGEIVIVSVARLAMRKRGMALINMLEEVRKLVPSDIRIRAILIGDGPDRGKIERAISHKGMNWVTLAGWQSHDEIREHYRNADIYVSPARLESFGIASLEACTAGLPVVALSESGVTEFIQDGVQGLLAADDAELIRDIAKLCTDPELLNKIKHHNQTVAPPFGWDTIVGQADKCYEDAIALTGKR